MILYFSFGFFDYFQNGKYETLYYRENFNNNTVNLNDQEFTFGINEYNGKIKTKEIEIESYYLDIENNGYNQIPQRKCRNEEFNLKEHSNVKS